MRRSCRRMLDLETLLKAGTLLYYREGAAATVSVKRLTGTTTLAVDGKTDASNRGDMLTQKLVAHLPLLLHEQPARRGDHRPRQRRHAGRRAHAIRSTRVDVIEISPEVVERLATSSPPRIATRSPIRARTSSSATAGHTCCCRDGEVRRDHLGAVESLDRRRRGALHPRVFRGGARSAGAGRHHLPVGNAYNISDRDLRSIVATFLSVFPARHGLAGRRGRCGAARVGCPLDGRLREHRAHWASAGVARIWRRSPRSSRFRCCRCLSAVRPSWRAMQRAPTC